MARDEWPEKGELVVCTVKELKPFGVFVTLEEYGGKEGLINIGEVSSGWVKHLRDYVREGEKIVCKVLHVDERRGHIDLSLKVVKESQKREKLKEWKNEKRAEKWLTLTFTSPTSKIRLSEAELEELTMKLLEAYGSLYDAFEDLLRVGKGALTELGIREDLAAALHEVATANIKLPSVQITGYVELRSPVADGVEVIKEALRKAEEVVAQRTRKERANGGIKVECFYIGAPRYRIRVTAPNYKEAESILSEAANAAIEVVKRNEGYGKFYRTLP